MVKVFIVSLLLISCGQNDNQDKASRVVITKVESCSVIDSAESATITCPDGTSSVILKPKDGLDGEDGKDGDGCSVVQTDTGVNITCGNIVTNVYNGKDGEDGLDGKDGTKGTNGKDGQGLPGKDGTAGKDGIDGAPGVDGLPGAKGDNGDDGRDGLPGSDGLDGEPGRDGKRRSDAALEQIGRILRNYEDNGPEGEPGRDGGSCSVSEIDNGARIYCEDGSVVDINFKQIKKKETEDAQDNPKNGVRK